MTKVERAIAFLVLKSFCKPLEGENLRNTYAIICKYMIQLLHPEMERRLYKGDHENVWEDVDYYYPNLKQFLADISTLEVFKLIEPRQSKQLLLYHFREPCLGWDVTSALIYSKILDEETGDELLKIIHDAIQANPKIVEDIKNGKDKAMGALVGYVMKKVKADPNQVRELFLQEIQK